MKIALNRLMELAEKSIGGAIIKPAYIECSNEQRKLDRVNMVLEDSKRLQKLLDSGRIVVLK